MAYKVLGELLLPVFCSSLYYPLAMLPIVSFYLYCEQAFLLHSLSSLTPAYVTFRAWVKDRFLAQVFTALQFLAPVVHFSSSIIALATIFSHMFVLMFASLIKL